MVCGLCFEQVNPADVFYKRRLCKCNDINLHYICWLEWYREKNTCDVCDTEFKKHIDIFVVSKETKIFMIRAFIDFTVFDLKMAIQSKMNISIEKQALFFAYQQLLDDYKLLDYGIKDCSSLSMFLRLNV